MERLEDAYFYDPQDFGTDFTENATFAHIETRKQINCNGSTRPRTRLPHVPRFIILLARAGVVTGWEFVSIGGDDVTLSVFDPSGGSLTVVNSTVVTSPADRPEAVSLLCFGADGFAVQPGESDSRNE